MKHIFFTSLFLIANSSFASEIENQCRAAAKVIALQSYETCLTEKKSQQVELLKQEYQEKALELKDEYESKIKDLHNTTETMAEDLKDTSLISEPTVVLKPATKALPKKANGTSKTSSKTKKEKIKSNLKNANSKSPKIIQKTEVNEITGSTESLEMMDPSLGQE
jgi:hypothetical protein